jgi:polar amino acid transport system substrate-binding protein
MRLLPTLLASAALFAGEVGAAPLTLCYEDVPQVPWTYPDGTGLNIELLKRVEKVTGETFTYLARPWKRCMEEAKTGLIDGLIGAADSPSRRQFAVPPLLPNGFPNAEKAMYDDNVNVFIRVGSNASWDGQALTNPRAIAIAQTGYFVVDLLRQRGQSVKDMVKSAEDGLRMLAAGSADVAVLMGQQPLDLVRTDPRFKGKIEVAAQPFIKFSFYLIVSRSTYNANPKRIEAIWTAIRDVRATPEYRALEERETRRKSKN